MQLFFIRHAQSRNNLSWDLHGPEGPREEDPEITAIGHQQAQIVANFLRYSSPRGSGVNGNPPERFDLTHLYCSLMVRSVQTAMVIARELNLPLTAWTDIHEGGGIYLHEDESDERIGLPGRPRSYFETHYPQLHLPAELDEQGWWKKRPYEERSEVLIRARGVINELLERHGNTDDRVGLVSHGGFFKYFIASLMGLNHGDGYWIHMNNTAISRIDFTPERFEIIYINRMDFIPLELLT